MNDTKPRISAIIPCFNARPWIEAAISSCVTSSREIGEIIVVDDGSTDGSAEIVEAMHRKYGAIVQLIYQKNGGASSARALGTKYAKGEWLYYLDSDDLAIKGGVDCLLAHSDGFDVVYGDTRIVDFELNTISIRHQRPPISHPVASILFRAPNCGTALVRRDAHGPYWNNKHNTVDEFFYFASLALNGRRFIHIPFEIVCYRQHNSVNRVSNSGYALGDSLAKAFLDLVLQFRKELESDYELSGYIGWILRDLLIRTNDSILQAKLEVAIAALREPSLNKIVFAMRWYGVYGALRRWFRG